MGFLSVINIIAMVMGYIVIILGIVFFSWILIIMIKDKRQRKKWEKEREIKEKTEKILKEKGIEAGKPAETQSTQQETQKTEEHSQQAEKTEEQKSTPEGEEKTQEKLVDEKGQVKMV